MDTQINSADLSSLGDSKKSTVSHIEEIVTYGSSFFETQVDIFKSTIRSEVLSLLARAGVVIFFVTLFVISTTFFMYGIILTLADLLNGQMGLSYLIASGAVLLFCSVFLFAALNKSKAKTKISRLKIKAEDCKMAAFHSVQQLQDDMVESLGIDGLVKKHPFYTASAAAASGFVLGSQFFAKSSQKNPMDSKPNANSTAPSEDNILSTMEVLQSTVVALLLDFAKDYIKQDVMPYMQDFLSSLNQPAPDSSAEDTATDGNLH